MSSQSVAVRVGRHILEHDIVAAAGASFGPTPGNCPETPSSTRDVKPMRNPVGPGVLFASLHAVIVLADINSEIVWQHVASSANATFRAAKGQLRFPYLVPAGPYDQLWDWDSVHEGVGMLEFGSAPYFAGSMLNFLDWVRTDVAVACPQC